MRIQPKNVTNNFTQESQLTNRLKSEISTYWQTGYFSSFTGVDGKRIEYAAFIQDKTALCLVISPGRSESYLKYQELVFDLAQFGINIFVIDHRGQGLSERLMANPEKGYVTRFDDYAEDLYTFTTKVLLTLCKTKTKPLVLAHSMGAAIAIRMMQLYPKSVQSAVLSSPMVAINTGSIPIWLAKTLVHWGGIINNLVSNQAWYFFGQGDSKNKKFEDNELMHSTLRYQVFATLYQERPELKLGGATFNWLKQAIEATNNIFSDIEKIVAPLTVLQAGEDTIVDNREQNKFCRALAKVSTSQSKSDTPTLIEGAYHELLFESDQYRNQALGFIAQWIMQFKK